MNGALGHDSALEGFIWPETTWANDMHFVMNHAYAPLISSFAPIFARQTAPHTSVMLLGRAWQAGNSSRDVNKVGHVVGQILNLPKRVCVKYKLNLG